MNNWEILIIFAVLFFAWKIHQGKREKITEYLKKQAIKRNGDVKSVFLAYPLLSFRYKESDVEVRVIRGGTTIGIFKTFRTYVLLYLTDFPDNWFDIRNKSKRDAFKRVLGQKDIQVENTAFNSRFIVQATNTEFIRTLLTTELQESLLQFSPRMDPHVQCAKKQLYRNGRSVFGEQQSYLSLSVRKVTTEDREYDKLIETTLMFHDRLKAIP